MVTTRRAFARLGMLAPAATLPPQSVDGAKAAGASAAFIRSAAVPDGLAKPAAPLAAAKLRLPFKGWR